MNEELENQTLNVRGVVKDVITQADLEAFQSVFWEMPTDTPALGRSANVVAALKAGWIEVHINDRKAGLTPEEVGSMDPRAVMFISEKVDALYKEFTTIPKN